MLRWLIALALGGIVGRLVEMERGQARAARERAVEAERLRDELGRRIDVQEATSRAARALGSSLDLDVAFAAFVQELRGLLPFDRAAILLLEGSRAVVMATAGMDDEELLGPGTSVPIDDSILGPGDRDRTGRSTGRTFPTGAIPRRRASSSSACDRACSRPCSSGRGRSARS